MTAHVVAMVKLVDLTFISAWLSRVVTTYYDWKRRKETFNQLHSLTDYELADIGISRGDIRSIANETWEDAQKRDHRTIEENKNLRGWV